MATEVTRDASEVGVHCHTCRNLDFLPFRCTGCGLSFCKDHATQALPAQHDCASLVVNTDATSSNPSSTMPFVPFKDLLPDRTRPGKPDSTAEELKKERKKQEAMSLLHKNFPQTVPSVAPSSAPRPTPKPVNKKVLLMKLKQRATAGDPRRNEKHVALKERRYFVARDTLSSRTVDVWLPADTTCGKALDLLADMMGVVNKNNLAATPACERLQLVMQSKDSTDLDVLIPNFASIGTQIDDGDEVRLVRGPLAGRV